MYFFQRYSKRGGEGEEIDQRCCKEGTERCLHHPRQRDDSLKESHQQAVRLQSSNELRAAQYEESVV